MPHSPPWTPYRVCQRSRAAVAQDSIPTEADANALVAAAKSLQFNCSVMSDSL